MPCGAWTDDKRPGPKSTLTSGLDFFWARSGATADQRCCAASLAAQSAMTLPWIASTSSEVNVRSGAR